MGNYGHIVSGVKGRLQSLQENGITHIPMKKSRQAVSKKNHGQPSKGKISKKEALIHLKQQVDQCTKCKVLVKNRTNTVFGSGHANAGLMFVGEAPGREEDKQGLPFVGRAGQLLTKMIESIGLTRSQVLIANVLKCRPPDNRNPMPEEIINCEPYLLEQLAIIQPKIICALGAFAAKTLLKTDITISRLRGQFHDYHGIKLIPTFHPAYLLRNPSEKRKVWEDMKMIKKELGL
ncbi:MAG: uracil-DNA glycosylase [Candidatus Omnitrophica bacterium]|nr:uracil-DNA glycosylase [Candidatus Omnitrophota bacterium]